MQPVRLEPVALNELPLTFAVDVSGSTSQNNVLHEEKGAISALSSMLRNKSLADQSWILPWNNRASSPVPLGDIGRLRPSGGTDPAALLDDSTTAAELQKSSIWFLMTDGEIDKHHIHRFANRISGRGIHGTSAVVILFGVRRGSPFQCNVSVGLSVFGVSPHCIFLFHDVQTSHVYVFQAKGCLMEILPENKRFTSFGDWTRWEDLVQITYEDLGQVKIPPPVRIPEETVLLPDGRELNMNDIYSNTLSDADRLDLLGDYPALDVVLLAAKTRGREREVRAWIENARKPDPSFVSSLTPEDTHLGRSHVALVIKEATSSVSRDLLRSQPDMLWQLVRDGSHLRESQTRQLRIAHDGNFQEFHMRRMKDKEHRALVKECVEDVVVAMDFMDSKPVSPATIRCASSPMSRGVRSADPYPSPLQRLNLSGSVQENKNYQSIPRRESDILFIPGFKQVRGSGCLETCYICRETSVIQTLLLRHSSSNDTDHFPPTGSQSGYKYPMVLGNFPETDILLPITSCDACASVLVKMGELPNGERVAAALPLVSLDDYENKRQWIDTLSGIYRSRFHDGLVLPVFLSTVCSTIEDLNTNDEQNCRELINGLEWCCRSICRLPDVTDSAALNPITKAKRFGITWSPSSDRAKPLKEALSQAVRKNSAITESSLISYPIGGFVVLVHLARIVNTVRDPLIYELFVWKRLLYHLVEAHQAFQKAQGCEHARDAIQAYLWISSRPTESPSERSPRTSLSLSDLSSGHLFSDDSGVADQFRRMAEHYAPIETTRKYDHSLAVFLHLLDVAARDNLKTDPLGNLAALRSSAARLIASSEGLHDIFLDPTLVDEGGASKMITLIRCAEN
jgi:hypothetical protein